MNPVQLKALVAGCSSLTTMIGISNFNTSNVTAMASMFNGCNKLTTINKLDILVYLINEVAYYLK